MIVRTTPDITGTDRQVDTDHWTSKRIVLSDDEVGFSYHETTVAAGTETPLHYPDYIEAVWLIEGHERHTIIADTQLRMYCVFTPAVPPGSD